MSTPARRSRTPQQGRAPHQSTRHPPTCSATRRRPRIATPWRTMATSTPDSTTQRCGCWKSAWPRWRAPSMPSRPVPEWPRWTSRPLSSRARATTWFRLHLSTEARIPISPTPPASAVSRRDSSTRSTPRPTPRPSTTTPPTSTVKPSATPHSLCRPSKISRTWPTSIVSRCLSTTPSARRRSVARSNTAPTSSGSRRRSGFTAPGQPSAACSPTGVRSRGVHTPTNTRTRWGEPCFRL